MNLIDHCIVVGVKRGIGTMRVRVSGLHETRVKRLALAIGDGNEDL